MARQSLTKSARRKLDLTFITHSPSTASFYTHESGYLLAQNRDWSARKFVLGHNMAQREDY